MLQQTYGYESYPIPRAYQSIELPPQFMDALLHLQLPLAKLPDAFGITEVGEKGAYPIPCLSAQNSQSEI